MTTRSFPLIKLEPITTVGSFLDRLQEIKSKRKATTWYRGQSKDYPLIPKVARCFEFNGKKIRGFSPEVEAELLHRFRRRGYAHAERILSPWEALILGRHHDLPTRLLDWTRNPLVALFFACIDNQETIGDVWVIARIDDNEDELDILKEALDPTNDPLKRYPSGAIIASGTVKGRPKKKTKSAVKIVYPFYNSPRILAQDGAFTYHSHPSTPLDQYDSVEFKADRLDLSHLFRIPVEPSGKQGIIRDLDLLGVNRRFVYPDLDGLARSLWEAEVLWRGK